VKRPSKSLHRTTIPPLAKQADANGDAAKSDDNDRDDSDDADDGDDDPKATDASRQG